MRPVVLRLLLLLLLLAVTLLVTRSTERMSLRTILTLLVLLSVSGTITLLVFGGLFKAKYPYLGDFEGDYAATASVCFQSALAFSALGAASALGLPLVHWWWERRLARRRALRSLEDPSKSARVRFVATSSF
jgi:hypothetical protein